MRGLTKRARKVVLVVFGVICLALGAVMTPLPTPGGIAVIALGLLVLVGVSATARRLTRVARNRWGPVDRAVAMVEARIGRTSSIMLRRTRPLSRKIEAKMAMAAADAALKAHRTRLRAEEEGGGPV